MREWEYRNLWRCQGGFREGFIPCKQASTGLKAYTIGMKDSNRTASSQFNAFRELASKLVQVPKSEAEKRAGLYQRTQKKKPKRGPKSA